MTIHVTADDIAGACQGHRTCPIARALHRQTGDPLWYVGTRQAYLPQFARRAREIPLPAPALEFVRRFDDGEAVEPLKFELPLEAS